MPWGAVVGAVVGGAIAADASKSAAKTQAGASLTAADMQMSQYEQTREDMAPWRYAGLDALEQMNDMIGLGGSRRAGTDAEIQALQEEIAQVEASPEYVSTSLTDEQQAFFDRYQGRLLDSGGELTFEQRQEALDLGLPVETRGGVYGPEYVLGDLPDPQQTASQHNQLEGLRARLAGLQAKRENMLGGKTSVDGMGGGAGVREGTLLSQMPEYQALMSGDATTQQEFLESSPAYQFRKREGMGAVQGSAAARGMLNSGRAMRELNRFGQGLASQEYGNIWNRLSTEYGNHFNRLASIANLGQTSTNQTAAHGANATGQAGNLIVNAGNATAAGQLGQANAIGSTIAGLGNLYGQYQQRNNTGGGGFTNAGGGSGYGAGLSMNSFNLQNI